MKKYASLLAVLVLLLGFASLSYSAPAEIPSDTTAVIAKGKTQITLGGELRFRGIYGSNLSAIDEDAYTPGTSKNKSYYDYRVRLNVEAKVSPNTTGYVELETGNFKDDNVKWGVVPGSDGSGAKGVYNVGNSNETTMYLRQAWIQYQGSGLLGVPAGVKVGKQLLKLGYGLFFDHTYFGDDAILAFVQPVKELTLAAITIKFREGTENLSDDANAYVLLGSYSGKGFGLSADVTYVDDQGNNSSSSIGWANTTFPSLSKEADVHLWNIGLRGNVDDIAGTGLNFRADVEFQTGKIVNTGSSDIKLKGWAALAGLDYKFKSIPLTLTAEYAIGSGDKSETADKYEGFVTALGNEQHYTFVYEYLVPAACDTGSVSYSATRKGLCNTQYVKLGGAYNITNDLKAELYGYWLRANKAVAINSSLGTGTAPSTDKDLGYEVDATVTYQIDKGLKYWVEGGYFWPGDAYKLKGGKDADDAWAVRHGIQLNF
ncbi:alginate export family protein [Thermodesulfovibrio yellowstonii]|uniref:Alginate export domain-containing protein n=1 Tax=Thermodesulfovibrio yellowstonii TaxID=28262 RepID=A0A9W6GHG4_9BACT|nr:alginate export family protein [Thermodesulfovibrio islandicus]GLI53772.1 hypothetical protein TISLANDTSLP1_14650 [Thermodesulfovibrio islandicus]